MYKIRHAYNSHEFAKTYEKNTQPGLTVPDQAMTIREIMERYSRGLPLEGERVPVYDGEDEFEPDLKHMDLADRQAVLEARIDELSSLKEKFAAFEKAKAKPKKMIKAPDDDQHLSDDDQGSKDAKLPPKERSDKGGV